MNVDFPERASAADAAKTSLIKRIRQSYAIGQAGCIEPQVNHAWIAGIIPIDGHWVKMIGKLMRIHATNTRCDRVSNREMLLGKS